MDLVKWLRKNNKKLMAVVVIVLMIAFIGPQFLRQLSQQDTGQNETLAYYGDDVKIKARELALAQRELEILKVLKADIVLKSIGVPPIRVPDLHAFILSELLFSSRETSPAILNYLKQIIRENGYNISDRQINEIYAGSVQPNLYWFLLKHEAAEMGIKVSNDNAADQLSKIIPRLSEGATYPVMIGAIVSRFGVSEDRVLEIFGNLMGVLECARAICTSESFTNTQIAYDAVREHETLNVRYVKLDSKIFMESIDEPEQPELVEHFEKYKDKFSGVITEDNPYGFGYKLANRVQFEYMAVRLDDVDAKIARPTQEELEEYYQRNRRSFVVPVLSDPNDPNSPQVEKIQSYGEVARLIITRLLRERVNSKAEQILQEARSITEAGAESLGRDVSELSSQEIKETAGDYKAAADKAGAEYDIKIHTGTTGFLEATDVRRDLTLGMLFLKGFTPNSGVGLVQMAFAIDELGSSELGVFDPVKPRMYENIGPLMDTMGQTMAVVRVIGAKKAVAPETLNQVFSKAKPVFDKNQAVSGETFQVRTQVVEDAKKLKAMDVTKKKAQELIDMIENFGWQEGLKKFNDSYNTQAGSENVGAKVFAIRNSNYMYRLSELMLETLGAQAQGNPEAMLQINTDKKEKKLTDMFYSLLPADGNSIGDKPEVFEFKPDMCYYIVRELWVDRLDQNEYHALKGYQVFREDLVQSQSLAAVYYNPGDIIKRTGFRPAKVSEVPEETEESPQSKEKK